MPFAQRLRLGGRQHLERRFVVTISSVLPRSLVDRVGHGAVTAGFGKTTGLYVITRKVPLPRDNAQGLGGGPPWSRHLTRRRA